MVRSLLVRAQKIVQKGKALDIGAYQGYESLFLACKGFDVTAVEISEDMCREMELMEIPNLNVVCQDIREFEFNEHYDLVHCGFVLHFLNKDARPLLKKVQDSTKKNGINVIVTFLDQGEFKPILDAFFKEGELNKLYEGWKEIIYFEKPIPTRMTNKDGSSKFQLAAFGIYKKK